MILTSLKSRALPISLTANVILFAAASIMGWRLIDARSDIKEEIGRCNTDKVESILGFERMTNKMQLAAEKREHDALVAEIERETKALDITRAALDAADTELQEKLNAIDKSGKKPADCGNTHVDPVLWRMLRAEGS